MHLRKQLVQSYPPAQICRGAQRRREHAAPVTSRTRTRRPTRPDTGHQTGFNLCYFNTKNIPNTHCDAGDVLLALVARHLSPVGRLALRRGPLSMQREVRITAGWKRDDGKEEDGMVAVDPWEATNLKNQTLSQLRIASWQPPGLRRCTKPFLPRRSQTRGEGGTTLEPLPHKRTPKSMRRASPCSIDRGEPLMPSTALLGLVKAESTPAEQTKKHPAAILTHFFWWVSKPDFYQSV